ncbi:MAG TPA: DNRLRE domain-containing protein, partial [Cystobacter sp.]
MKKLKSRNSFRALQGLLAGLLAVGCSTEQGLEEEALETSRLPLVSATTREFVPTHDVVVKQGTPTTSYNDPLLCAQYDGTNAEWIVLKFNTTGLVAPFSRVTLRLPLSPNGNTLDNFRVYNSTNTGWAETITWNTRPTPGTSYVTVPGGSLGSAFFDIDVTPLINTASSAQTLIISPVASADTDALCFYDQTNATVVKGERNKPRLVVDYYGSVPAADAHVDQASSTTNFGTETALPLNPTASEKRAYLQFPVSRPMLEALRGIQLHGVSIANTLPSPRGRVMLRLYPTTSVSGTSAAVYAPNSGTNWTTWSETGLTWANQPAGTGVPAATRIATIANTVAGRWTEVDVTQAVTQAIAWADTLTTSAQDVSLNLLLASGSGTFASKEDATFKPMLVFISDELPVAPSDGICGQGEDCASNPTECGTCAAGANRGGYIPVWGDLHRHALSDGKDGWSDAQVESH